jgi:hypothetical protein
MEGGIWEWHLLICAADNLRIGCGNFRVCNLSRHRDSILLNNDKPCLSIWQIVMVQWSKLQMTEAQPVSRTALLHACTIMHMLCVLSCQVCL